MTRHEEREKLVQLLFMLDFYEKEEIEEQTDLFRRLFMGGNSEGFENIKTKALSIIDKLGEIDVILEKASTGWPLSRMGKTELTILRVATYEILFDGTIPESVAINEAVELSKAYSGDMAFSFVNGVLAKLVKKEAETKE